MSDTELVYLQADNNLSKDVFVFTLISLVVFFFAAFTGCTLLDCRFFFAFEAFLWRTSETCCGKLTVIDKSGGVCCCMCLLHI